MTIDQFLHYFLVVYCTLSVIFGVVSATVVVRMYLGLVPLAKVPSKNRVKVLIVQQKLKDKSLASVAFRMTAVWVVSAAYIAITWPFALMR